MSGPRSRSRSPRRTALRRWHGLVEHYTPDGAPGRLLLGGAVGTAGAFAFWLSLVGLFVPGLLSFALGLVGAGATAAAAFVTVTALWPVYLSLIGNVESAAAYESPGEVTRDGDSAGADEPVDVLKRRYAAGEISDAEFERRLAELLGADAEARRDRSRNAADRPRGPERRVEDPRLERERD